MSEFSRSGMGGMTLAEARGVPLAFGEERSVHAARMLRAAADLAEGEEIPCADCVGLGFAGRANCGDCDGLGETELDAECRECGGTGWVTCPACDGERTVEGSALETWTLDMLTATLRARDGE